MSAMQLLVAIFLSLLLAVHGLRKKSLSPSGALAGLVVGLVTFNHPHPVFGFILVAFYLSGSRVTKIGRETKVKIEEDYHEAGQRNAWQVICNGGVGTILALAHLSLVVSGSACNLDKPLSIAYLAHYACCAGDTFASEIGTAFASKSSLPILITSGRRVPHGTNGGITPIGTLASFGGGSLMGLVAFFVARFAPGRLLECGDELVVSWFVRQPLVVLVVLGGAFGLGGSMIDSVLGATLQATYHDLKTGRIVKAPAAAAGASHSDVKLVSGVPLFNNDAVNLLASGITAAVGYAIVSVYV